MAIRKNLTGLTKISYDTYMGHPSGDFSVSQNEDALRKAFNEACGGEFNYNNFIDNRGKVYAIVGETMVIGVGELLTDKFDTFIDFKDTALGDENLFVTTDNSMFRVDAIADGNGAIRRQKLYNGQFSVPTIRYGVKIYTELERFIAGKVDWASTVNRVMVTFANHIGVLGYNAMVGAKGSLPADQTESGAFAESTMDSLIETIQTRSGSRPIIYGTPTALGKITQAKVSEKMIDELNTMGHYGVYKGYELRMLPQGQDNNKNPLVSNSELFIIPGDDEKIIKVALEGEPIVYDKTADTNNSHQIEMFFGRRVGATAIVEKTWGIYTLS